MTEAAIRAKRGMVSVKDMPMLQDGPPPGGFPPVRYVRRIPNKGPGAVAVFLTSFGVIAWGMYQVGQGNKHRRYYILLPGGQMNLPTGRRFNRAQERGLIL
eukprot:Gb_04415 [translate_table: standard]